MASLTDMATFPTLKELLIPNLNIWTIIGIFAILVGGFFLYFGLKKRLLTGLSSSTIFKLGTGSIFMGILLIWGISIIQDFLVSTGGRLIALGTMIVVVLWFVLFYRPRTNKGNQRRKTLL